MQDDAAGGNAIQVVGVGASAHGLEPLILLLEAFDAEHAPALVIVTHMAPEHETHLDEILSRRSRIRVEAVEDGVLIEPGRGYLIPPGREMIASGGRLLLTDRDPTEPVHHPIDAFFHSLAIDYGSRCAALVLSGGGTDGSRGIREINRAGGLVLAQDPETAMARSMPDSAIATGFVHAVLPPEAMASEIDRHSNLTDGGGELVDTPINEAILDAVRDHTGIDFRQYKATTALRRLQRRMVILGLSSQTAYAELLAGDLQEVDALYHDLLIGVTRFFRDGDAFEALQQRLADLLAGPQTRTPLRAWVPGCATGEEVYSLAMVLHEVHRAADLVPNFRIFATDIHRGSLDTASAGRYPALALAELPPALRARYFTEVGEDHEVQVSKELRDCIVFARHDVTRDPPFTRVDLVSCRNLLIYFQVEAQRRVMTLFHFALRTGGLLFLGPSETPGRLAEEFEALDRRWRLYRKKREIRLHPDFRASPAVLAAQRLRKPPLTDIALQTLVEGHAPPTLLVDGDGCVAHAYAGGSRYLRPADGPPTSRLLDLLHGELKNAVSAALQASKRNEQTVWYRGISVELEGQQQIVDVQATRLPGQTTGTLVHIRPRSDGGAPLPADDARAADLAAQRVAVLEHEVRETQESLQGALEEMEAANEELQTTNEELIASNEELQSTNEELNSVNEELYTVNSEYQEKIDELQRLSRDMEYVLAGSDVHVLFLDGDLKIRDFTAGLGALLELVEHDAGRRVELFASQLTGADWLSDLRQLQQTHQRVTHEVVGPDGQLYLMRMSPYQTTRGVEGAVIVLSNLSDVREMEAQRNRLARLLDQSPDIVMTFTPAGDIVEVNEGARAHLPGLVAPFPRLEALLESGSETFEPIVRAALATGCWKGEVSLSVGETRVESSAVAMSSHMVPGFPRLLSIFCRDIGDLKAAQREREAAARRKDQFLAALSHELRNPINALTHALGLIDRQEPGLAERAAVIGRRQILGLRRLVDDLLDASRIDRGRISLHISTIDLTESVTQAVETLGLIAPEATVEVHLPAEPIWIAGDAARLQQIYLNLLTNAARYGERTPIWVRAGAVEDQAVFTVEDGGVGLDPEDLERIFDAYYQVSGNETQDGIGIGLKLTRELVNLHGGTIQARSPGRGRGSVFEVRMPCCAPPPRSSVALTSPSVAPGSPLQFLLVDDNADSTEALALLLDLEGHRVRTAGDLMSARVALAEAMPDVLICDVGLPDGSGVELAELLARSERRPRVMFAVSGYGQPEDIANSLKAGFDAHMVKPVDAEKLLRAINDALSP